MPYRRGGRGNPPWMARKGIQGLLPSGYRRIAPCVASYAFPSALDKFLHPLTEHFHWDHFTSFRLLVVIIAFLWGRTTLSSGRRWGMSPWQMTTWCSQAYGVRHCAMVVQSSVARPMSRRSGAVSMPGLTSCLETHTIRRCICSSSLGREGHDRLDIRLDRWPLRGHH